ncbi:hypothetical protein MPSEU_001069900 [Mayamaea pseudoterrestris]|nr:hypothetical protein MPSEU_001069900 [Mayamaea pseudoterrestris]
MVHRAPLQCTSFNRQPYLHICKGVVNKQGDDKVRADIKWKNLNLSGRRATCIPRPNMLTAAWRFRCITFYLLVVFLNQSILVSGTEEQDDEMLEKFRQLQADFLLSNSSANNLYHDPTDSFAFRKTNGLFVLSSNHLNINLLESQFGANFLLLVMVYDEHCPACHVMMQRVEEASMIHQTVATNYEYNASVAFGTILASELKEEWLVAIDTVPSLLFLTTAEASEHSDSSAASLSTSTIVLLEYYGLSNRARDIADTVLHYSWRLQTMSQHLKVGRADIVTSDIFRLENLNDLHYLLFSHRKILLHLLDVDSVYQSQLIRTGLAATGQWTTLEMKYLEWLLSANGGIDDLKVFVHCRRQTDESENYAQTYEQFARVVSNRRDFLFLMTDECDNAAERFDLVVYSINVQQFKDNADWELPDPAYLSVTSAEQLDQLLLQMNTPSVLGFDRQLTAPIAFPLFRKVHAVLFIETHNIPEDPFTWDIDEFHSDQRQIVGNFQRVCGNERRRLIRDFDDDIVCLVVTSSETRVLTSFGIDYRRPLDWQLFESANGNDSMLRPGVLPSLLVTDQRYAGTRRYYLDVLLTEQAIETHFAKFWAGLLEPERISDPRGPRINNAGIRIAAGDAHDFMFTGAAAGQHSMILFQSSTCGHCKRFKTLYNQLSELLSHVGWSDMLALYEMDVTNNDLIDLNVTIRWTPDLYYIPPFTRTLLPFVGSDTMDDGVGALNSALEIIEWFLDASSLTESEIGTLLSTLR